MTEYALQQVHPKPMEAGKCRVVKDKKLSELSEFSEFSHFHIFTIVTLSRRVTPAASLSANASAGGAFAGDTRNTAIPGLRWRPKKHYSPEGISAFVIFPLADTANIEAPCAPCALSMSLGKHFTNC